MMRYLLSALAAVGMATGLSCGAPVYACGAHGTVGRHADKTQIAEEGFVPIGGIEQWISIHGDKRENPVIIVIHGGPAVANSALQAVFSGWEKYFTVVQWDQRGAGKTFGRNGGKSTPNMSLDRMVQDGIEVVENIGQRLGKQKVILLGHSWGSFLGVTMIKMRPDLFSAYVGTGQVVSFAQTIKAQYDYVMNRAEAEGNQDALRDLREIGPPPYEIGPKFFTLQKLDDHYNAPVDTQYLQKLMEMVRSAPNFTSQDVQDWMAGRQFSMQSLASTMTAMDLPAAHGYDIPVPFFIIQGQEDNITPTAAVEDYFQKIRAPRKEMALIKGGGHFAYATNGQEFLADLVKFVGLSAPGGRNK